MVDRQQNVIARNRSQIPGAEFVAAGVFAGAITFGMPPGIGSIFGDANEAVMELSCDETLHFVDEVDSFRELGANIDETMPGILELERGLTQLNSKNTAVLEHLNTLVTTVAIPKSWRMDNVQPPSRSCKQFAQLLLERLHQKYGMIPIKLAVMKDGGLLASFKSVDGNTLRVEIDEDLDAVAVVTNGKEILFSAVLEGDDLEEAAISVFKDHEMVATFVS